MSNNQETKVRALKRLILAHITFQQVIAACEFLIDHDSDEHTQSYGIFFSGICVSYMRPYMSAERLGPLPADYSTFPNAPDHARTHEDLKNGRNWAYAHNSPDQAAGLLTNTQQQEEQKRIRFVLDSHGLTFHPPEVTCPRLECWAIYSTVNSRDTNAWVSRPDPTLAPNGDTQVYPTPILCRAETCVYCLDH